MPSKTSPSTILAATLIAAFAFSSRVLAADSASLDAAVKTDVTRLPEITVTAQKEPELLQNVPVSVTAVTGSTIQEADIRAVKQAAEYAPNVFINEFSARKLSNPYVRGIGSSPTNPGVTTYIDGVPQLNANSSNIELIDIDQVEFVRGPQGALFGRNTLGGLINILSNSPSFGKWTGGLETNFGSYDFRDVRLTLSGPVVNDMAAVSFAGGYSERDGYTMNRHTGNDLDGRGSAFGKFQLQLKSTDVYNARLIFFAEHDNDGDYPLGDLNYVQMNPRTVDHNFEGYTHRDIYAPTLLQTLNTDCMQISSITGAVLWRTVDLTDLDYTAAPLAIRHNEEKEYQLTQEFRFASLKDAPIVLCDDLKMSWQSGIFTFFQKYNQDAVSDANSSYPYVMEGYTMFIPIQVNDQIHSTLSNWGGGIYGQGTLTAWDQLDAILGLRYDVEKTCADLSPLTTTTSSYAPPNIIGKSLDLSSDYGMFSPQFGLAWHVTPEQMLYAKITRGFKAGGFNAISPVGNESYGEEKSWCYEIGAKTEWLGGRLRANVAAYYISWNDLQLNQPVPNMAGRFYIGNAGSANSKGVELELNGRPLKCWDVFGSIGYTDARFDSGSFAGHLVSDYVSETVNVSGNRLPYAPLFTANIGTQVNYELDAKWTAYARLQATFYGNFEYDALNRAAQGSYNLVDARVGLKRCNYFAEFWVNNAFNSHYVPIAFEYSKGYAPSGYLGESGAPVTIGVRAGMSF